MPVTLGLRGWGRETASLREAWAQDETLPQKKIDFDQSYRPTEKLQEYCKESPYSVYPGF